MSKITITSVLSILAILVLLVIGAVVFGHGTKSFGSVVQNDVYVFSNGLQIGTQGANSQLTSVDSAKAAFNAFTLGAIGTTTSTALSSIAINSYHLAVGDPCVVGVSTAPSNASFNASAQITSVSGGTATATIDYLNSSSSAVTIATGTVRVACMHLGIN